jgi:N-acetylglucosaminyldiphosphoundecaprenol N-acetyl-beta-D-mannosaminyltransferase
MLAETRPDIVYVGLGFPKQEHLIEKLRPSLPDAWFLGIGISFSFVAGQVKRAPRFMQRLGLEWLHRMAQEPGRLLRRYLVHGIPFAIVLLALTIAVRVRTSSRK